MALRLSDARKKRKPLAEGKAPADRRSEVGLFDNDLLVLDADENRVITVLCTFVKRAWFSGEGNPWSTFKVVMGQTR